jgi:hypothetical protein
MRPGSSRIETTPRLRKLPPDKDGYLQVGITVDGQVKMRKVHHLVLEAFVGLRPPGTLTRHKDGVPSNNSLRNLAWGTQAENELDAVRHGTHTRGEQNGNAKLTQREADEVRVRLSNGEQGRVIARDLGVSDVIICRIKKGYRYAG